MRGIFIHIIFTVILLIVVPFIFFSNQTKEDNIKIKIYNKGNIIEMDLEEYVKCVVASEMPAEFCEEALKAQAIAARTFAYKRIHDLDESHNGANVCADFRHCQAYNDKQDILKKWGDDSKKYWEKISRVIDDTKDLVICFKGDLILPVFHSNSVGKTESSKEIWSHIDIPYLQSVDTISKEDGSTTNVEITVDEFREKILKEYPNVKFSSFGDISKVERNESNRVRYLIISGVKIEGEKFRNIFSLKSTNFKIINVGDNKLNIEVLGNGHGVGLSQIGANEMAKNGKTYQEILKHYYNGVNIQVVKTAKNQCCLE